MMNKMTSKESAERKCNIARAARVIARYRNYAPSPNDDLGEFLSHYRRLWLWATGIAHRYIDYMDPQFDLIGDLLGFLGEVHYTYIAYGYVRGTPTGKAAVKTKPKKNSIPRATYTGMLPLLIFDNPRPSLVRARPSPPSEETSVGNMKRPKMKLDKKDASPNLAGIKSKSQSPWMDLLEPEPYAPSNSKQEMKHLDEIASNENMEPHQHESTEALMAHRRSSATMTNVDKNSEKENSEEDPNGNPDINPTQPAPEHLHLRVFSSCDHDSCPLVTSCYDKTSSPLCQFPLYLFGYILFIIVFLSGKLYKDIVS
ncbi:hypothetical protein SASPL_133194 [Salvia splendens]|uniref:Uncharacterized protein n=1 Tax=Salvia splendens TaxID=180675 RepID=A0A8X8X4L9_SALSN|nr:hypothetical protein SASPL_133194 [Salvia splendens]